MPDSKHGGAAHGSGDGVELETSVAKGATSLYVANVVSLVANTLYFLILTNILQSTVQVGVVTALNIMIWLIVTVCILAQPVVIQSPIPAPLAVLKFLPELVAKGEHNSAKRIFNASLAFSGLLSGLVAGILMAFPNLVIPYLGGQAVLPLFVRLAVVDVFAIVMGQVGVGVLIALADVRSASTFILLWSVVRYVSAAILLIPYAVVGVLMGWIIGDATLLVLALWRAKSKFNVQEKERKSDFSLRNFAEYSLYTLVSALIGFAINQADRIFTLARQGLGELAIYNVAIVAASFAGFAPYALLTVLLPALSSLHASDKLVEMRSMIHDYTRYVSIVVLPVAFGFASVTGVALRIFGPAYESGLLPSMIVSVVTGLTALSAVYAGVLLAIGKMKWFTLANVLGLASLFVVSAVLTPIAGLSGPAIGRATLMAIVFSMYALASSRNGLLELDSKAFAYATVASAIMGVIIFSCLSLTQSFFMKLALLPFMVVFGALIYVGFLRALRLFTSSDFDFVSGLTPARFQWVLPKLAWLAGVKYKPK